MRIVVVHPVVQSRDRWARALAERLPEAQIVRWRSADDADPSPENPENPEVARTAGSAPPLAGGANTAPESFDFAVGWNPPADFFDRARIGNALFSAGAGVDHLLRHPGLPATLDVVRLEDAGMGVQMAEYCVSEVLRVYRRQAAYERQQRERVWREIEPPPRARFGIGILGIGVLGAEVARAIGQFGFPVSGYSRTARRIEGIACFSGADALPEFLARCAVLIVLAPLTASTEGFVNRQRLAMLPRGAWLINVARGGLVVDSDLIAALDDGHLAGATLDVFRVEPLPAEHAFWRHPKIRITPHVSAMTLVDESATQIARKIRALGRGEAVGGLVDRARGY